MIKELEKEISLLEICPHKNQSVTLKLDISKIHGSSLKSQNRSISKSQTKIIAQKQLNRHANLSPAMDATKRTYWNRTTSNACMQQVSGTKQPQK